jgi:hypothetical protein
MTTATMGKKERIAKETRATNRNGKRPETMEEIGLGGLIPGSPIEPETIDVEAAKKKATPAKGKPEPEAPPPKRIRKPKPAPEAPAADPAPEAPPEAPEQAPEAPQGEPQAPEGGPEQAPEGDEAPDEGPAPDVTDAPGAWGPPEKMTVRPLTDEEQAILDRCEARIRAGMISFVDTGLAMAEIKATGVYCYKYDSFESYVEERWGYDLRHAYYLMTSATEVKRLESLGVPEADLPNSMRAARELTRVPEDEREEVIRAANELARSKGRERATGAEVRTATQATGKRSSRKKVNQPDEVIPREVARARRNGTIPEGTEIEVTQVNGDLPDEAPIPTPDQVFDRAKYLDQFPIRESLGKNQLALFDAEALFYQRIEDGRKAFIREHTGPGTAEIRSTLHRLGPYSVRIQYALRLPDPSKWVLCESCKGAGEVDMIGKAIPCNDCKENGFIVRAEKD